MASEHVQTLTDGNFEAVIKSDTPVLVDFWAEWCAPCRRLAPAIEAIANEFNGRLIVGKLNVDEHQEVSMRYNIRGIPTLILFKAGDMVEQVVGLVDKDYLKKLVERHL
ncbi:MAG: thioredoxin [Acidobacteria bacterium]|nr:thioredoxin [Acidobacteriota bacterium]